MEPHDMCPFCIKQYFVWIKFCYPNSIFWLLFLLLIEFQLVFILFGEKERKREKERERERERGRERKRKRERGRERGLGGEREREPTTQHILVSVFNVLTQIIDASTGSEIRSADVSINVLIFAYINN